MMVKGGGGRGVWGLGHPQFQVTLANFKWVGRGRGKIVMNANLKLLYKKKCKAATEKSYLGTRKVTQHSSDSVVGAYALY